MTDLHLVVPSKEYQQTFERYVQAYLEQNDGDTIKLYQKGLENFDEYLHDLHKYAQGVDLSAGYAAASSFWLVDGYEVVGVVRIRPQGDEYSGHIGYDISPCHRGRGYGTVILKLAY